VIHIITDLDFLNQEQILKDIELMYYDNINNLL